MPMIVTVPVAVSTLKSTTNVPALDAGCTVHATAFTAPPAGTGAVAPEPAETNGVAGWVLGHVAPLPGPGQACVEMDMGPQFTFPWGIVGYGVVYILVASLCLGCAAFGLPSDDVTRPPKLGMVNPTPNVLLPASSLTISLNLDAVDDEFHTAENQEQPDASVLSIAVTGWRGTLENGFSNGYARYFAGSPARGATDLALVVRVARLAFVDLGMGRSNGYHRIAAQIRFQAELIDAQQRVRKTWADTAVARTAVDVWWHNGPPREDMSSTTASAVEAMFEGIANGMPPGVLQPATPQPHP